MFSSVKVVSTLAMGLSLINYSLSSPLITNTFGPSVPTTCPLSTITETFPNLLGPTSIKVVNISPACPTVTSTLLNSLIRCPTSTYTGNCVCPVQPATSTVTYGCIGSCCPSNTPTIIQLPTLSCPTACAAVCTTTARTTSTVTVGC